MQFKSETRVLAHPITRGSKTIKTITLHEPDVDGLEQIEALDLKEGQSVTPDRVRKLIAILAGWRPEVADQLHWDDAKRLFQVAVNLIGGPAQLYARFTIPNPFRGGHPALCG